MSNAASRQLSRASERRLTPDDQVADAARGHNNLTGDEHADEASRAARKRRAIIEAATALFLRHGYQGTSMDDIAALAAVSKQTVYKHFTDKEQLFSDITLGVTATAEDFLRVVPQLLEDTHNLQQDLQALARRYLTVVMQPQVLQLRRLVIAEAGRFPELARTYYQRAPERVLTVLALALQRLAERGLLRLDDALLAANHFAFLVLGPALDKAMFCGDDSVGSSKLEQYADAGVRVFLAAYGHP